MVITNLWRHIDKRSRSTPDVTFIVDEGGAYQDGLLKICARASAMLSGGGRGDDVSWFPQVARKLGDNSRTVTPVRGHDSYPMMTAFGHYQPPLQLDDGAGLRSFCWQGKEMPGVVRPQASERGFLDVGGMAAWAKI